MKRSIIATLLLVSVVIICICGYIFLNRTTDELITLADSALKYAEENNKNEMLNSAYEIRKIWQKKEAILSAITPHQETENMASIIEKLIFFAENENPEEYKEYCIELKTKALFVKEEERLSVRNIF